MNVPIKNILLATLLLGSWRLSHAQDSQQPSTLQTTAIFTPENAAEFAHEFKIIYSNAVMKSAYEIVYRIDKLLASLTHNFKHASAQSIKGWLQKETPQTIREQQLKTLYADLYRLKNRIVPADTCPLLHSFSERLLRALPIIYQNTVTKLATENNPHNSYYKNELKKLLTSMHSDMHAIRKYLESLQMPPFDKGIFKSKMTTDQHFTGTSVPHEVVEHRKLAEQHASEIIEQIHQRSSYLSPNTLLNNIDPDYATQNAIDIFDLRNSFAELSTAFFNH